MLFTRCAEKARRASSESNIDKDAVAARLPTPQTTLRYRSRFRRHPASVLSAIRSHVLDSYSPFFQHNKMKTPLRIAILQCDTPPPDVVALYGAYDRIFTTLLEKAAEGIGLDPKKDLELSAFEVVTKQEYPDLDSVDAVLISGSSE